MSDSDLKFLLASTQTEPTLQAVAKILAELQRVGYGIYNIYNISRGEYSDYQGYGTVIGPSASVEQIKAFLVEYESLQELEWERIHKLCDERLLPSFEPELQRNTRRAAWKEWEARWGSDLVGFLVLHKGYVRVPGEDRHLGPH